MTQFERANPGDRNPMARWRLWVIGGPRFAPLFTANLPTALYARY